MRLCRQLSIEFIKVCQSRRVGRKKWNFSNFISCPVSSHHHCLDNAASFMLTYLYNIWLTLPQKEKGVTEQGKTYYYQAPRLGQFDSQHRKKSFGQLAVFVSYNFLPCPKISFWYTEIVKILIWSCRQKYVFFLLKTGPYSQIPQFQGAGDIKVLKKISFLYFVFIT